MLIFESILAAILPMVTYTLIIWKMDKFDREPISLIIKSFFYGAFIAVFIAIVGSYFISYLFYYTAIFPLEREFVDSVIVAPSVEEFAKMLFLFILIKKNDFDNFTDGLVYGSAIGLGFGMTENFLYFFSESENINSWVYLVIVRSLFSAVMHGIATASVGALISLKKYSHSKFKFIYLFLGFSIAVCIHFLWNFLIMAQYPFIISVLYMIFIISIFIMIFRMSLKKEIKFILFELKEEVELGYLSQLNYTKITLSLKQNYSKKENRLLINNSIKLAFKKHQFHNTDGDTKDILEYEIKTLRHSLYNSLE